MVIWNAPILYDPYLYFSSDVSCDVLKTLLSELPSLT